MASADTLDDDDVDPAELAGHVTHPLLQRRAVPDVDGAPGGLHTLRLQRGDGTLDVVGVTGADGHVGPLVGERLGDGASDAPRAPGDDGVQTFESQIHVQLPSRYVLLMAAPTVYFGSTKLPNLTRPHWLSIM